MRFEHTCPKFGVSLPKNRGPKPPIFDFIPRVRNLTAKTDGEYSRSEIRYGIIGDKLWKLQIVLYRVPEFNELWIHKRLTIGPDSLLTVAAKFISPSHRTCSKRHSRGAPQRI